MIHIARAIRQLLLAMCRSVLELRSSWIAARVAS